MNAIGIFKKNPVVSAPIVCASVAGFSASVTAWLYNLRLTNVTSKNEAEIALLKNEYEAKLRGKHITDRDQNEDLKPRIETLIDDVNDLTETNCVMKLLTRLGYLVEEQDLVFLAETDTDTALAPLQSAACTYRIARGPRAGQKVATLRSVPSAEVQPTDYRCANAQGFSLHAEVRCAMNQRHKLPDRPGALPPHRTVTSPQALLRTAHASFPACGSSISKAPIKGPVVSRLSLA